VVDRLHWIVFGMSRRHMTELDRLVCRIEANACGMSDGPTTGEPTSAGTSTDDGPLMARLRRADEALRAVREPEPVKAADACAAGLAAEPVPAEEDGRIDEGERALPRAARELISLRDEALLAADSEHTTVNQVSDRFFRRIGEILEADGITPTEPSEVLDPERQHVIGTRPTEDPALHGRIAEVVGPGYVFRGRVIRPEQVVTWRKSRSPAAAR
jgi:hypothetical protein